MVPSFFQIGTSGLLQAKEDGLTTSSASQASSLESWRGFSFRNICHIDCVSGFSFNFSLTSSVQSGLVTEDDLVSVDQIPGFLLNLGLALHDVVVLHLQVLPQHVPI